MTPYPYPPISGWPPSIAELARAYSALDPRDRTNALWVVGTETYRALAREYPAEGWPPPERVEVGRMPRPERDPQLFGLQVWVRSDLPSTYAELNIDDEIERAIKRHPRGTINIVRPGPLVFDVPPAPPPTLKAVIRKWVRRWSHR